LEKVLKGVNRVKQIYFQTLRHELVTMKMKKSENVFSYITRVQTVGNKNLNNRETHAIKFFNH